MSIRFFVATLLLLAASACAHTSLRARGPASVTPGNRLADSETAPNQEVYWTNEEQVFRQMQKDLAGDILRPKTHTCLRGYMIPARERSQSTRHGIFKEDGQWQFWARFSNSIGWRAGDNAPDLRGLSIKVIHVPGSKLMEDELETQDLVMSSAPVGLGSDAADFMEFTKALSQSDDMLSAIRSSIRSPEARTTLFNSLKTSVTRSLITLQFWTGTAYRLGSKQAVKYTVKPEKCVADDDHLEMRPAGPRFGTDKFRKDLYVQASMGFCMGLYVQRQSADVKLTPIEDAAMQWPETVSPLERIGQLNFFPQTYTDDQKTAIEVMCTKMSFNPWHSLESHRPLGNLNRAGRFFSDVGQAQNPLPDHAWDFN